MLFRSGHSRDGFANLRSRDGQLELHGLPAGDHWLVHHPSRTRIAVRIVDGAHAGFGECAPLAGLHRESIDECVEAIERWSDGEVDLDEMPPSAAFAASCAIETAEGFGTRAAEPVAVAAFFPRGIEIGRAHV